MTPAPTPPEATMHVTDEMAEAARSVVKWLDGFRRVARDTGFLWMADDAESHARALEAALRAAPAAEPVAWPMAWLLTSETTGNVVLWTCDQYRAASEELKRGCKFTPLYTAPPAPAADGWVMVPKDEMTDAMMDAGRAYLDGKSLNGHFRLPGSFNWHEFWHAMLAAAPTEAGR